MTLKPGRRRIVLVAALAGLLLLPPVAQAAGEPYMVVLWSRILIWGLAAASLDLILGYGGLVSLGHAAFVGMGGYAMGILAHHAAQETPIPFLPGAWTGTLDAWLQWPLAMAAAGALALVIGALSLRTAGVYFIMITLAFAQMLFYFFVSLPAYGGEDGLGVWERSRIPGLDLADDTTFYYVCLALLLGFLWIAKRLVDSRFGMILRGVKQNERRLKSLGCPTVRTKLAAFVIAGMAAGLAGALAANQTEYIDPGILHWTKSGEMIVMVILGGMGTLVGPVFGAAALLLLEDVLAAYTEHWMIVLGPVLVFVVLFARRGLYGWLAGKEAEDG